MCALVLSVACSPMGCRAGTVEVGGVEFVARNLTVEGAAVAAADFDRDGHQDLVCAGQPRLTIFRGDGKGNLDPLSRVPGGENPVDFAIADLDEDGNLDIAVANHDTDYLTILLGDGSGAFRPAGNSPLRIEVRPHPHAVRAVDVDVDGHVDLVVDHRDARGYLVLRGLGEGRFASPGTLVEGGGDPYRGMAIGDIDGDGRPDLVAPNPTAVGVLLNAADERIAFVRAEPVAAAAPFAVDLGDFNGDDRLDLIVASGEGSPLVEIFFGDGRGGFEQASGSPFRLAPGAKDVAVGDFDGDGIEDAAVSSYRSSEVLVLLGGRDSFRTGSFPAGEHPWGLAAADLNEDGIDDLVIADDATIRATVFLSIRD